jgi:hypothetical protein
MPSREEVTLSSATTTLDDELDIDAVEQLSTGKARLGFVHQRLIAPEEERHRARG